MAPAYVEPNHCLNCINDPKPGTAYPCSACRDGDKWVKKAVNEMPEVKLCRNCLYQRTSCTEKPCNTCVGNDNWLPVCVGAPGEVLYYPGESDPLGTEAHAPGAKLDAGKVLAGVLADFSLALLAVAEVGTHGAEKYSRGGWQSVPEGETRYKDADWRHLLKGRHEDTDPDSGLLHEAHRAWNVLAALELRLRREKGK